MSKTPKDRAHDLLRRYWNGEGGLSDDLATELASALAERDAARRRLQEMRSTSLNFQIERDAARAEVRRLREALDYIVYADRGRWRSGIQPDCDVTAIVAPALGKASDDA